VLDREIAAQSETAVPTNEIVAEQLRDWWRTPGAAVVEHTHGVGETACSLFFYDRDYAAWLHGAKATRRKSAFMIATGGFRVVIQFPLLFALARLGWVALPTEDHHFSWLPQIKNGYQYRSVNQLRTYCEMLHGLRCN